MLNGNFCILILDYLDFFLSMDVNFVLNFVAAPKMPSYFCCFPICFSLPDNCDQFQVPLQGIFALNVLWWVISSSAVRMGRSAWRFNSSWNFFVCIDKIEYFFLHWNIAFFSLKYSKGKFPLLFCSEKWRTTAEIQGKSNDSLLFT